MSSLKTSVKHVRYVLGSLTAVLFVTGGGGSFDPTIAAPGRAGTMMRTARPGGVPHGHEGVVRCSNRDPAVPDGAWEWSGAVDSIPATSRRLVDDALATLEEFGEPGADAGQVIDGPLSDPAAPAGSRHPRRAAHRRSARGAVAVLRAPVRRRRHRARPSRPRRPRAIPVTAQARPGRAAGRLPVRRRPALPGDPHHGHHRTAGRDLAVPLRDGALAGPGCPGRRAARRTPARRRPAGQRQLPGHRQRAPERRRVPPGRRRCRVLGIVPPDEALDSLANGGATQLATVAELPRRTRGRRPPAGDGPGDFRLRTIDVGGEVLSPSLAQAARETFGVHDIKDLFAMTEVVPVFGRTCTQGHLHFDINTGARRVPGPRDRRAGRAGRAGHGRGHPLLPVPRLHAGLPVRHPRCRQVPAPETHHLRAGRPARHRPDRGQGRPVAAARADRRRDATAVGRSHRGAAHPALAGTVPRDRPRWTDPAHPAGLGASPASTRPRRPATSPTAASTWTLGSWATTRPLALRPLRSDLHETTFAGRPCSHRSMT